MRKISGWVAIVVVPTLVAGIYGMNFDNMPELHWHYGYFVVLGSDAVDHDHALPRLQTQSMALVASAGRHAIRLARATTSRLAMLVPPIWRRRW